MNQVSTLSKKRSAKVKKCIIIALLTIISALIIIRLAVEKEWLYSPSQQTVGFMKEINAHNVRIQYYGNIKEVEWIEFPIEKITNINEEIISDDKGEYYYHAIILFDLDGSMNLTNDQLLLLKKYAEDYNYDIYVYGRAHIQQFYDCNYLKYLDNNQDGFIYNGSRYILHERPISGDGVYYLNIYLVTGYWMKEDAEKRGKTANSIWHMVTLAIYDRVKLAYGENEK